MNKAQQAIEILEAQMEAIRAQIFAEYDGTMSGFNKHPLYPALTALSETAVKIAMNAEMLQPINV